MHLTGLYQGCSLKELIHGAKTTRHRDETRGILHKHGLAGKEIAEINSDIYPFIHSLLVGKLDSQADGGPSRFPRAFIGCFHNSRSTTGNHGKASLHQ